MGRDFWSRMWPQYFKQSHRKLMGNNAKVKLDTDDVLPDHQVRLFFGDQIVALEGIKWSSEYTNARTRQQVSKRLYKYQMKVWETGSAIKVVSGMAGTIVQFVGDCDDRKMYVEFDEHPGMYVKVFADQVTLATPLLFP